MNNIDDWADRLKCDITPIEFRHLYEGSWEDIGKQRIREERIKAQIERLAWIMWCRWAEHQQTFQQHPRERMSEDEKALLLDIAYSIYENGYQDGLAKAER